jgi:hypothetical protein
LHRKIARLLAAQNAIDIGGRATVRAYLADSLEWRAFLLEPHRWLPRLKAIAGGGFGTPAFRHHASVVDSVAFVSAQLDRMCPAAYVQHRGGNP